MLKKTKIICTQGPATDAPGIIEGLIENGMNATATTQGIRNVSTPLKPPRSSPAKLFR